MKRNSILVVLFATVVTVCLSSCKNGTSSDKSDEKANVEASTSENGANQEAGAPLLNATDLMAVYDNLEDGHAYREDERLDGYDPYSNSKSCAALAIHSYKRSFLDARGVAVSDLRAGNVIGGGDYAADRILPDCVRSALKGENVKVRNPHSVRPYQHVLEPLSAYLLIGEKTYKDPSLAGVYNVGPDDSDAAETGHIAELFTEAWGEGIDWEAGNPDGPHEANYLRLSHEKITEVFGWHPVWNVREAVQKTVEWTKAEDKKAETEREIKAFLGEADY